MIRSMTAFASRSGADDNVQWTWDIRSVNGRGLDMRLRVPDGIDGLEQTVRAEISKRFARGNITVNMRLSRDEGERSLYLDEWALDSVLNALETITVRAKAKGVQVEKPSTAEILQTRGVWTNTRAEEDADALKKHVLADLAPLLDEFAEMRAAEGAALHAVISEQLDRIEALIADAQDAADKRRPEVRENFKAALQRVMEDAEVDESRLAQELAIIAVKQDVTEELDRLKAHVAAARALISDPAPAGRKLDFLAQEFNREVNTLCSKSQATGLTQVGLELKAVIEQMREQIQNVE
ncbi:YicC/YloC family endoribonuclease [Marivivens aquimaris]|uniref:YicC/YloC family endoribonuclease n=1 Tax=Marivivens aquimaris TaxID=2774876 RepID=UPI002AD4612D|nr:YicC/YloC family endoribonuclease [Marivivens aquimaris]